jgi:hypothetical protein
MADINDTINALRIDFNRLFQLEKDRIEILSALQNAAWKDEREHDIKEDIDKQSRRIAKSIQDVIEFPPHHHKRHETQLEQFHQVASFEKSVFVMTKFPDKKNMAVLDQQLDNVIQCVRNAVDSCGYKARVAIDNQYHPILWDNVELYLLGCCRGIAIVEDKYLPELNPNVSMEWGWMRGMGRRVLYLVEKDFKLQRADWSGLIESPFEWDNPVPEIQAAISAWLK